MNCLNLHRQRPRHDRTLRRRDRLLPDLARTSTPLADLRIATSWKWLDWHRLSVVEAVVPQRSLFERLAVDEVERRLAEVAPNELFVNGSKHLLTVMSQQVSACPCDPYRRFVAVVGTRQGPAGSDRRDHPAAHVAKSFRSNRTNQPKRRCDGHH